MSPVLLDRALNATEAFLERRAGVEAIIARAAIGRPHEDDEAEATRLVRTLLEGQSRDGSFDGNLSHTARVLVQIREVSEAAGLGEVDPGVGRGLDWLRGRQGRPGRWSDGCTPDRHAAGLCHHFIGGFFAPAPPEAKLPAMDVSCGITLESDGDIRFAASCLALRTFWRWQAHAPDAALHLDGVRAALASPPVARLSAEAVLEGLATLLDAPQRTERLTETMAHQLDDLAARQLGDGSWGNLDVFHALDVLLRGDRHGVATVAAERALDRSAHLLASAQQPDGSWGSQAADRRALLGWRAMRRAADREAGGR